MVTEQDIKDYFLEQVNDQGALEYFTEEEVNSVPVKVYGEDEHVLARSAWILYLRLLAKYVDEEEDSEEEYDEVAEKWTPDEEES